MFNLSVFLEDSAREVPERTAIISGDTKLSYADVNATANQVANVLVQAGIQAGDLITHRDDRPVRTPDDLTPPAATVPLTLLRGEQQKHATVRLSSEPA